MSLGIWFVSLKVIHIIKIKNDNFFSNFTKFILILTICDNLYYDLFRSVICEKQP